jgi:hypothetical protein
VYEKKEEIKKQMIRWSIVGRIRQEGEMDVKRGRRCTTQERSRCYLRLMHIDYAIRCTETLEKLRQEQG